MAMVRRPGCTDGTVTCTTLFFRQLGMSRTPSELWGSRRGPTTWRARGYDRAHRLYGEWCGRAVRARACHGYRCRIRRCRAIGRSVRGQPAGAADRSASRRRRRGDAGGGAIPRSFAKPAAARYADQLAERIEGFARSLHEHRWGEMIDEVEGIARRRPVLFVLGTVAVGFLAGRLLSDPAPRDQSRRTLARGTLPPDESVKAAVSSAAGNGALAGGIHESLAPREPS